MLRSWNERIVLALSPSSVTLIRKGGWQNSRITAQVHQTCCPIVGESSWIPAVQVLGEILQDSAWQQANTEIRLSNHFVKYALIPPAEGLESDEERQSFARHFFAGLYGAEAETWAICTQQGRSGVSWLAGATDGGLMAALNEVAGRFRLRLRAIRPMLNYLYNPICEQLNGQSAWLVFPEPGQLLLVLVEDGEWKTVIRQPADEGWRTELPAIIRRLALARGKVTGSMPVHLATLDSAVGDVPVHEVWRIDFGSIGHSLVKG